MKYAYRKLRDFDKEMKKFDKDLKDISKINPLKSATDSIEKTVKDTIKDTVQTQETQTFAEKATIKAEEIPNNTKVASEFTASDVKPVRVEVE